MDKKIVLWLAMILSVFFAAPGAFSSSFQRLYVVNEGSDSVSVIDPTNLSIVADVPTGSRPHYVNVDPEGRYFYVTVLFTRESDDLVQVFDVKTNTLVTSVVTGHQPAHVVPDRTGSRLYVSNEAGTTLSIISVPEFKVVETVKLKGKGPHGHVLTPDGRFLLTPNGRSGDVSVVDLVHQTVDRIKLPSGAKPVSMGITSDGRLAFVTDAGLDQVHKIDVAQRTVSASLSVGKRPTQVPVHPTRPFLYIPCMESAAVYKVDINNWKVEKVIPVGQGPHGIAYSADGRYAYVTLSWEKPKGRVAVIDTETDSVRTTFAVNDTPYGVAALFGKNQGW
ncbi:MAG: beta-propeller fold lactonase family protein [Nitrospirae bacterium]|nr:beta-propeller fold lactonase family protein [Nitrospirota bacterium]